MYRNFIKRVLDIICALLALTVFCWLYGLIALLVRVKLGSPVIFKQPRPGKDEKIFVLCKFRTMTDERDEDGNLLPDEVRLTKFGRFLRSASLDELPEAWNILKGDMSVVGPRPQLVRDMVFMSEKQRHRHDVKPGLTGLAQVNGRNCIEWEDKINFDLQYIKNISFLTDLKIVFITVIKVLKTESISYEGMATAEDLGDYLLRTGMVSDDYYSEKQEEAKELVLASKDN